MFWLQLSAPLNHDPQRIFAEQAGGEASAIGISGAQPLVFDNQMTVKWGTLLQAEQICVRIILARAEGHHKY